MVKDPVSFAFLSVPVRSCAQTVAPTASAARANMILRSTLMESPVNGPSMIAAPLAPPASTCRVSVTTGPPNVHGERPFSRALPARDRLDRTATAVGFSTGSALASTAQGERLAELLVAYDRLLSLSPI